MYIRSYCIALSLLAAAGCNAVLGLQDFSISAGSASNERCADAGHCEPAESAEPRCRAGEPCALKTSEHCPYVFGAAADAHSVRFGAIFEVTGTEAQTGNMQARATELAVTQLNKAGGVKLPHDGTRRPLALIVCDNQVPADELQQVLDQLNVSVLLGPSWSRSLVAAASRIATINGGAATMLLGPSTLGANAGPNSKLTWGMTLSEVDRAPLLLAQLRAIAATLDIGTRPLRVAFLMRTDVPITSVRAVLAQIASSYTTYDIAPYEYASAAELTMITSRLATQRPDVVVGDGASEVGDYIALLERALASDTDKPQYLLTEAAQVPQLLTLVAAHQELQNRVHIIGAAPTASAADIYKGFETAYHARYVRGPSAVSGVAASYSAVYAVVLGLMAVKAPPADASALAEGLRALGAGGGVSLSTSPEDIDNAVNALGAGRPVAVTGTLGDLGWNEQGSPLHGRVSVFCVRPGRDSDGEWAFVSTNFAYDFDQAQLVGSAVSCAVMSASVSPPIGGRSGERLASMADAGSPEMPSPPAAASASHGGGACGQAYRDCDGDAANGCEVDVSTTKAHCGECTTACSNAHGTTRCIEATCAPTCNQGFGDCDGNPINGCETALNTTVNCGMCGRPCPDAGDTAPCNGGNCATSCELSGVFSLKLMTPVTWPATAVLTSGSGTIVSWARVQLNQSGTNLNGSVVPCGQTVPDFQNAILGAERYGVDYATTIFDRTPPLPSVPVTGLLAGTTPGSAFSLGRTAWLMGTQMSDPVDGAWPNARDLRQRDDDADGQEAITAWYKPALEGYSWPPVDSSAIARSDRCYLAARVVFALGGTLNSCTQASGAATAQGIDSRVIGCRLISGADCDSVQADHLDTYKPAYTVGASSYTLVRIADDADCSGVRAARP
jgi:ABC-type branched-subunit amino acid transport system substrate-binding protein